MIIEQATVDDAAAILALQKLAYQDEAAIYGDFSIPPLTQTLEQMRADFGNRLFLKAVANGVIIGSVCAHVKDGTCHIGRLIVLPEHRNRGVGSDLMAAIEERFREAARYELFTGDRSERNLYLYKKLGYQPFKTEQLSEKVTLVFLNKPVTPPMRC
jgi:GNAT superfamily N-acetyltransferase